MSPKAGQMQRTGVCRDVGGGGGARSSSNEKKTFVSQALSVATSMAY